MRKAFKNFDTTFAYIFIIVGGLLEVTSMLIQLTLTVINDYTH
jgi:hypothetical protein